MGVKVLRKSGHLIGLEGSHILKGLRFELWINAGINFIDNGNFGRASLIFMAILSFFSVCLDHNSASELKSTISPATKKFLIVILDSIFKGGQWGSPESRVNFHLKRGLNYTFWSFFAGVSSAIYNSSEPGDSGSGGDENVSKNDLLPNQSKSNVSESKNVTIG